MSDSPLDEWNKVYIPIDDPVFNKAYDLALAFSKHCQENNLPESFVINNVSCNTSAVREQSYIKGKKYEQERIAILLGLNSY